MTSEDEAPALGGVLPVLQTPFTADGEIAYGELEQEIHWVIDNGADGVVVGMVSEVLRMSSEERDALSKEICRVAAARGRISIVSVGAESAHTAARHARTAQAAGASGLMAIPPLSTAVTESELLSYYEAILSATEVPLVVQDASGYVGNPMSVETQALMSRTFGSRVLFKPEADPTGPKLSALRDATNSAARILEGSGGLSLVDSFRRGIVGTMPGSDVCWAISQLWTAMSEGDEEQAYRIHGPLVALVSMQTSLDAFVAVEKYLLHKQGVFSTTVTRGPVGYLMDTETAEEVDRLFAMLQAVCGRKEARR